MYDRAVEMAARNGKAATSWRKYFPQLAEFEGLMSIGMLTETCCSDVQSDGGRTLSKVLDKKTKATKGDKDETRVYLLNDALQSIAKVDNEKSGLVARAPGELAWMEISKAVLESDAFKNQECFDNEYLGRRGGMHQWWAGSH